MLTAAFFYGLICDPATDPLCVSMRRFSHTRQELNKRGQKFTFPLMTSVIDQFSNIASELLKLDNKLNQVLTSYIVRVNHATLTSNIDSIDEIADVKTLFTHPYMPLSWKNITNTLRSL